MTLSLEELEKLKKLSASKKSDWYLLEPPWLGAELTAVLEGAPDPHGGKFLFDALAHTDCVSDEESDANIAYSWAVSELVVQGINALPALLSMAKRSLELEAENEKLREGLEALASLEAMTTSFRIKNNSEGEELKARVEFARNLIKGGE